MSDPASSLRSCPSGQAKGLFKRTCAVEQSKIVYLAQCFARASLEGVQSRVSWGGGGREGGRERRREGGGEGGGGGGGEREADPPLLYVCVMHPHPAINR